MSIREDLAKDIVTTLKEIEDPKPVLVTREPFDVEKLAITQFPAILVQTGDEIKETTSMGAPSSGRRISTINYQLRCFVRGNELDTKRNDLIESIEEILDTDRYRGKNAKVVVNSQITQIEVIERLQPLAEFNMTFEVIYQHVRGAN
jgi:hypothetical protein